MLCFVVVMQSFVMNSHEVFIHIHQGCFPGTGAIVRLLQCQWSKPDGYGKISQCITTTKHSKAKTVCIFLGIYCMLQTQTHDLIIENYHPRICQIRNLTYSTFSFEISMRSKTGTTYLVPVYIMLSWQHDEILLLTHWPLIDGAATWTL